MRIYAVVALLTITAAGQQQPPQTPAPAQMPQANIKFTAESSLVVADVTVKDPKTGQPIEGLKASDFTVLEDNKPQKIQVFEFMKLAVTPAPPEPPPTLGSQNDLPEDPKTSITVQGPGKIQYHDKRLLRSCFSICPIWLSRTPCAPRKAALKFSWTPK